MIGDASLVEERQKLNQNLVKFADKASVMGAELFDMVHWSRRCWLVRCSGGWRKIDYTSVKCKVE